MWRKDTPMRTIPFHRLAMIGDYPRWPGCRLLLTCGACGWNKTYDPARVLARLQQLRAGGHTTPLSEVVRRIQWPCPGCHRLHWRIAFALPDGHDPREARRLTGLYRN